MTTKSRGLQKWVDPGHSREVVVPVPWHLSMKEALDCAVRMVEAHGCKVLRSSDPQPWPQFRQSFRPSMGIFQPLVLPKIEDCPTPIRWDVYLYVERTAA